MTFTWSDSDKHAGCEYSIIHLVTSTASSDRILIPLESNRALRNECRAWLWNAVGQRELETRFKELFDVWTADVVGLLDLNYAENLLHVVKADTENLSVIKKCKRLKATHVNRPEASAMPGSHILVQALDGISPGEFTILLVHIMGSRTRVISEPDAKILDFERFLFVNLNHVRSKYHVGNGNMGKIKEFWSQQSHSACLLGAARETFWRYIQHWHQ